MANPLPTVHPTRPVERALWMTKAAVRRSGVEDRARALIAALARPSYRRSLRAIPNREELPAVLVARGLLGTAVEIGVARGVFSEHILRHWPGTRLISVDPWLEMPPEEYVDVCNTSQESMEENYGATRRRLASFGQRSEIWRLTGDQAVERVGPESLDFLYLDAMHSYEAVLSDLTVWYPRMRPGAIMAGHDYNDGAFAQGIHGVRSAVDEFFAARGVTVAHTHTDVPSISWIVQVPRRAASSQPAGNGRGRL